MLWLQGLTLPREATDRRDRQGEALVTMVTEAVSLPGTLGTRPTKVGDVFLGLSQDGVCLREVGVIVTASITSNPTFLDTVMRWGWL